MVRAKSRFWDSQLQLCLWNIFEDPSSWHSDWYMSLRHNYKVTRFYFEHTVGTKIAIPEISLNTRDFPSVRLATRSVTWPQRCFRRTIPEIYRCKGFGKLTQIKNIWIGLEHSLIDHFINIKHFISRWKTWNRTRTSSPTWYSAETKAILLCWYKHLQHFLWIHGQLCWWVQQKSCSSIILALQERNWIVIFVVSLYVIFEILILIAEPQENKLQYHVQEWKCKWVQIIHYQFEFCRIF
jgi:hypothetical protein